jgi:hypothetical protein
MATDDKKRSDDSWKERTGTQDRWEIDRRAPERSDPANWEGDTAGDPTTGSKDPKKK